MKCEKRKHMTSRERVICTVEGNIPDRVPMDFGATSATLNNVFHYFGLDNYKMLMEKLNIDIFDMRGIVEPVYKGPVPDGSIDKNGIKQDFWGIHSRIMNTATGFEECPCDFKLKGVYDIDKMERYPWPNTDWFDYSYLKEKLLPWKDFAILAAHGSFFQMATNLRSFEDFFADIIINREAAEYLMDKFANFYLDFYEKMFNAAPGLINIIRLAEDIGMQDRPLVSVEVFDTLLAPRIKKFVDLAHCYGAKFMFHSCGSIVPFIEKLIDIGVDILDPIQVRAKDMDPSNLKKKIRNRICLHGSVDTQHTLPRGSVDDVEREIKDRIKILGCGGRFILAPCHVLQTDVPMENIETLYRTGYKYGFYTPV